MGKRKTRADGEDDGRGGNAKQLAAGGLKWLLERCTPDTVPLASIDEEDGISLRSKPSRATDADRIAIADGVLQACSAHPILLVRRGERLGVLNGALRIRCAKMRRECNHVEALIIDAKLAPIGALVAAFLNCGHGDPLSPTDRREFYLRNRGKYQLTPPEWAHLLVVSRQTPHNWEAALRTAASKSAQNGMGHRTSSPDGASTKVAQKGDNKRSRRTSAASFETNLAGDLSDVVTSLDLAVVKLQTHRQLDARGAEFTADFKRNAEALAALYARFTGAAE